MTDCWLTITVRSFLCMLPKWEAVAFQEVFYFPLLIGISRMFPKSTAKWPLTLERLIAGH